MNVRADGVQDASAAALRVGSASFHVATRLFDAATRRDAQLLYAWCRRCDDVIDGQTLGFAALPEEGAAADRLASLRAATLAALRGESVADPAFVAFQRVAARHRIPERYPLDLLEGFRMDVERRRYRTIDDTLSYSYHVAGVVGLMMAIVMGVPAEDDDTLDRACDLGLAFQLTNIARDVIEDASNGRVYLPEDWLAEAGIEPDAVAAPERRDDVHRVALRLLGTADIYYASALDGIGRLPVRNALAIGAARAVYRGIGERLRRGGSAAWDRRIRTSRRRKLALVASGSFDAMRARLTRAGKPRPDLWARPRPV